MELSLLAVILGFILDLIVGDPHWLYHPIRLVGHLISGLESCFGEFSRRRNRES